MVSWFGRTSAPTVLYAVVGINEGDELLGLLVLPEFPDEPPPANNAMPAPMVASVAPVAMPAVAQENVFLLKSGQMSGFFVRNSAFSQLLFMDTA